MKRIICIVGLLMAGQAQAHSWYPAHCCHEMDCAPVEKVEIVPLPRVHAGMASLLPQGKLPSQTFVTTKHGTVLVPENFKRETSKDGQMHACIRDWGMGKILVCIFDPPGM